MLPSYVGIVMNLLIIRMLESNARFFSWLNSFFWGVVLCLRGYVFLSWSVLLEQMEKTNTTNKQGPRGHQHRPPTTSTCLRSKSYPMLPCCELSQSVDQDAMRIKQRWLLCTRKHIVILLQHSMSFHDMFHFMYITYGICILHILSFHIK